MTIGRGFGEHYSVLIPFIKMFFLKFLKLANSSDEQPSSMGQTKCQMLLNPSLVLPKNMKN